MNKDVTPLFFDVFPDGPQPSGRGASQSAGSSGLRALRPLWWSLFASRSHTSSNPFSIDPPPLKM